MHFNVSTLERFGNEPFECGAQVDDDDGILEMKMKFLCDGTDGCVGLGKSKGTLWVVINLIILSP